MKKIPEGAISLPSEDAAPLILCGSTYLHVNGSQLKMTYLFVKEFPRTSSLEVSWKLAHVPGDL